jgi:hypothetical protein
VVVTSLSGNLKDILQLDENEIKASNGSRYWNSLYMQDPTPEEGWFNKKEMVTGLGIR